MQPLTTLEALRRRLAVLSAIEESVAPFVSCYLDLGHGRRLAGAASRSGREPCARRCPGRGARVFIDFLVARFQPTSYWDLNWAPTGDSATAPRRYTRQAKLSETPGPTSIVRVEVVKSGQRCRHEVGRVVSGSGARAGRFHSRRSSADTARARGSRSFAAGEYEEIERVLCESGREVIVERSPHAIVLYGRSETALKRVVHQLAGYRWQHLAVDPPQARSRTDPVRVAWMHVHVRSPRRFAALIKDELFRRGGRTSSAEFFAEVATLSGHAPLAYLIGYSDWVAQTTDDKARVTSRLAERRIGEKEPEPPGAFAA